ncbi:glycerophosphodiester phosphodiesterase family protein [uncultured Erythrobacter sp.]|uniref:glycerophosphodiester phosphodiesterase family protein n=1 Tax=uncultured Erythrobacter sp. TaxID=263913 RepID=UPI00262FAD59|nr:glycerophosphodiester phosphodiesterase family protein [uncultured Erythrobacter sp.]
MTNRQCPDWLTQWEYAHRGLHSLGIPENSIEAARAAIDAGMGIECDIQRSRDGLPMVFHDWELDRLTGSSGLTEDRTQTELEAQKLFESESTLPSLTAFLQEIAGAVPLLIELKSKPGYDIEVTCEIVARELDSYSGDCAVMSFDPRVAQWFRHNAAQLPCGLVMREDEHGDTQTVQEQEAALAHADPDFLAYHIAALPSPWVAELRAKGLPVLTWTVNSPEARSRGLEHADALIAEREGLA